MPILWKCLGFELMVEQIFFYLALKKIGPLGPIDQALLSLSLRRSYLRCCLWWQ